MIRSTWFKIFRLSICHKPQPLRHQSSSPSPQHHHHKHPFAVCCRHYNTNVRSAHTPPEYMLCVCCACACLCVWMSVRLCVCSSVCDAAADAASVAGCSRYIVTVVQTLHTRHIHTHWLLCVYTDQYQKQQQHHVGTLCACTGAWCLNTHPYIHSYVRAIRVWVMWRHVVVALCGGDWICVCTDHGVENSRTAHIGTHKTAIHHRSHRRHVGI